MTLTDGTMEDTYASRMCEIVAWFAAELEPRGIEYRDAPMFQDIIEADVGFLIGLGLWEGSRSESNWLRLHTATGGVIDAWKRLARYYGSYDFRPMETPR